MPKVSVVVPTYNQSKYLPICLDSIWFQDYPNLEIIIVNDGSSDDTESVLADYVHSVENEIVSYASNYEERNQAVERRFHHRYAQEGRKIRIISHSENSGLSNALNTGFQAATGDLCTFIASDDAFLPSAISVMHKAIQEHNVDFVFADMHIVDDDGRILRRFSLPDYSFQDSLCAWYLMGICKLYKKELHTVSGYYDPEIAPQDHDMFLRFAMDGATFFHVKSVQANARIHDADRKKDNHAPAEWNKLYRQSAALVLKARQFAAQNK